MKKPAPGLLLAGDAFFLLLGFHRVFIWGFHTLGDNYQAHVAHSRLSCFKRSNFTPHVLDALNFYGVAFWEPPLLIDFSVATRGMVFKYFGFLDWRALEAIIK